MVSMDSPAVRRCCAVPRSTAIRRRRRQLRGGVADAALAGALLGFLRFNTHPARVFMGDGGSQVLGFLAWRRRDRRDAGRDTAFSAALPLLLLAWPILDTLAVMSSASPQRAARRSPPIDVTCIIGC